MRILVCVVFVTWLLGGSAWLLSQGDGAGWEQLRARTTVDGQANGS